ncbi:MAG: hypothetical protein ACK40G_13915 [Cytophagaceae bacterium]
MSRFIYQRFTINAAEGASSEKTFEFNRKVKKIVSVQVTSSHPDKAYFRGSNRIEISGEEFFAEGHETKLMMSNQGVAPEQRFTCIGDVDPGNYQLKINYKDTAHASAAFGAYSVTYIFKCIV